jgi:ABC-type multidrug transport system fused ATPase/permease subunit
VAVVGTSGAGKSTLAAVLLRFLDHEGQVEIDGVPLAALADADVRDLVVALTQDAHVFDSSVAENLRLARREATDDDLVDVLRRARLGPWLESLPQGLATPLGAHGTGISGGEAQRLALARVLLSDRPVMVLDEPTEHLDPETADALAADLLALTRGRSTVYVTHRLVGLEEVDEILFLAGGRVVERGRHEELVAAGGVYARRWAREVELRGPDPQDGDHA